MLGVGRLKALFVAVVPVLTLIFLLSCQGLPAHSEDHGGCQPVIAAQQGPSFITALDAPAYVCPTLPAIPAIRPVGWERPWMLPIARAQDPPSSLSTRAPPSPSA